MEGRAFQVCGCAFDRVRAEWEPWSGWSDTGKAHAVTVSAFHRCRRRERAEAERKASQAVDGLDVRLGGGQGRQDFADEGAAEGSERAAKLVARQMGVSQQQAQVT